jgi:prepilin-type N-terminal cleavage/methylation domain-containing protein
VIRNDKGFTLIELLIVVAIIGVLSAIATATVMNARMSGNEASAVASMRVIVSAQIDYHGLNRGYAVSLAELASRCPGSSTPFLSSDLNANGVTKSGFTYTLGPGLGVQAGPNDCNGAATQTAFYSTAIPITVGRTGNRAFATNAIGAIWQDTTGVAPPEPFVLAGNVSPVGR